MSTRMVQFKRTCRQARRALKDVSVCIPSNMKAGKKLDNFNDIVKGVEALAVMKQQGHEWIKA